MTEREIFTAALEENDPVARAALLDEACAGDANLRERVESLLAEHEKLGSFMNGPPQTQTVDRLLSECPGTQIGPYKLLQQIGEGGFGIVFMAEQVEPVRRRVALKVIKPGMDTRQVIARFEAERQALAVMDHANIAKVLDAGTTEGCRPYFVMELVRGTPITQYCDESSLSIRERLALFASVCQAIQHAHTKGIIHRDIKPTNVLVTRQDGQAMVKVIDFGIAKALGQQLTGKTLFTDFAQMIGTPLYMSPEQAERSSNDIDTRSDIYSLGVLLYELLTGSTPVRKEQLKQAAFDEIRRIIREDEPQKPSTRISTAEAAPSIAAQRHTEPAKLTKLVRGELDWIVMKALEKDRNRRYETANGLASDIEHYLRDEPVAACPPSVAYRFRKFVRRNKAALAMAGVVFLALLLTVVGLAGSNVLVRAERNEKIAALEQKEKALREKQVALGAKEAALKEARRQEQLAKTSAEDARKQQRIAHEQEQLARRRFHAAQMNLAMQAWEEGHPARTLQLLESLRPRFDDDDLRGFDWYYLWRLCQGTLRYLLPTLNYDNASAIAISPDGATLASGYGNSVRLWDVASGRQVGELPGHVNNVSWFAFAPDGKTLASTDESESVKLWDLATSTKLASIQPGQRVGCVQFTADGRMLVLSGKRIQLWDLSANQEVATLGESGYAYGVLPIAASPDGAVVAASGNGFVRTWIRDGSAWREAPPLTGVGFQPPVAISPDGKLLAVGYDSLKLYDLPSVKERTVLQGHTGPVFATVFTADGKRLASGGIDRTVRIWDLATGQQEVCIAQPGPVYGLALTADGGSVASLCTDAIRLWDVAPLAPASVLRQSAAVDAVAFSSDGKMLAAFRRNEAKLWDVAQERNLATLATGAPQVVHFGHVFAYNADSLVIPNGNAVEVWSVSGQRLAVLTCDAIVYGVAWSPDGMLLAAITKGGAVEVWDVPSQSRRYATVLDYAGSAVAFSPDGKTIAAGYQFGVVKLFDAASGRELSTLQRFELAVDWIYCLAFSPDSRKLATGNRQGLVRIWDLAASRLDATLIGHTDAVRSLAFLDDGRTLATGSEDRTVRLWDAATGQERVALEGHASAVTGVAFSKQQNVLATSSLDGTVRIWRAAANGHARAPRGELDSGDGMSPVAECELGDRLWQEGRVDEAEAAYRRALDRLEKLLTAFPEEATYQHEMIRSLLSVSLLLRLERANQGDAESARQRAMEMYRKLSPQHQKTLLVRFSDRDRSLRQMIELISSLGPEEAAAEVADGLNYPHLQNSIAWGIAVHPDARPQAAKLAVRLAQQAVARMPGTAHFVNTLGTALYRAGDWKTAIDVLKRADELSSGRHFGFNAYFIAMALWRLEEKEQARRWYAAAQVWMERLLVEKQGNLVGDDQNLPQFRAEAAALLGLPEQLSPDQEQAKSDNLAYYDLVLAANPQATWARPRRGCAHGELGHWAEAAADFTKAIELNREDPLPWYWLASVRLQMGDVAEHRQLCADMLGQFGASQNTDAASWTVWTCALAPDAVTDWRTVTQIAEKSLAADPKHGVKLQYLGAVLYRAGQFEDAAQRLTEAEAVLRETQDPSSSHIYTWLFLAMTEQRLGHAAQANAWLEKAIQAIEQPANEGATLAWNRRLTIQLFRREAEELIKRGNQEHPPSGMECDPCKK